MELLEKYSEGCAGTVRDREAHSGKQEMRHLSVLLSHPTGNQNVRNALRSLSENEMLAEFWTTLALNPDSKWNGLLPAGLRGQLEKRAFPEAPPERIKCVPSREIVRLAARGSFLQDLLCAGERPFSVIGMYRHFDGHVAKRVGATQLDAVYAYEGGALRTFGEAKRHGVATVYEQPSSYWYWARKLLQEEAEKNPEFAGLLPALTDSTDHLEWKDKELELADFVIVPSEHVRCTLKGAVPDEKIRVINYGAPGIRKRERISLDCKQPLQVLFVGLLAQHKGIGYLLDAIDDLRPEVDLTLVGRRFRAHSRVDAACGQWRWFESLPHAEVLKLMLEADVLVLPSLTEGCALVVLEALACGLPVIVTPNTGSLEFVHDGCEGFVVPICQSDAIAERLHNLHRNREQLAGMSRAAQATAEAKSWDSYRANLADSLRAAI